MAILLAVLGCEKKGSQGHDDKAPAAASTASPSSSSPGEDPFCNEHGVVEALCTKCNPTLIPVFQAKGNWCAEHGFPESICPICHPERGGRPAVDGGVLAKADGAPADGTKVRLKSKETARLADIRTEKAVARTGNDGVVVTAKITYDATKLADVNARAAGVVRELKAEVGASVKRGATLAVIESAQVGADRSKLTAVNARVKVSEENLAREKQLHDEKISSRKSLLEAQQELEAARAEQASIASGLAIIGGAGAGGHYTLTAPFDGTVTVRKASIGKLVDPEEALFQVVDTSLMWAELDVPEKDLSRVHTGQAVALTLDAVEGDLAGTLDYLAPAIDAHTRTAKGRVRLDNRSANLRANMYGRARIVLPSGQAGVLVPRSAIQRAKDVTLVFVRLSEEQYEARRVQLGAADDERIEVTRGVKSGEDVVTQGSFLLKTETLKDSIGAGCCD